MRCLKGASRSCLFLMFWDQDLVQGSQLHLYHATDAVEEKKETIKPSMCDT